MNEEHNDSQQFSGSPEPSGPSMDSSHQEPASGNSSLSMSDHADSTPADITPSISSSGPTVVKPSSDAHKPIDLATALHNPEPPVTPPNPPAKKDKKPLGMLLMLLVGLVLAAAAAYAGYTMSNNKAKKTEANLNSQLAVFQSNTHELPADAIKVSECIPNMGSHYLPKGADAEYGPFLLVTKANKVIGIEYMASADMYMAIPQTDPPVEFLAKDSPMYGWKFDHAEFTHMPKGHEGLTKDHIDVHLYTVTPDQEKKACI